MHKKWQTTQAVKENNRMFTNIIAPKLDKKMLFKKTR